LGRALLASWLVLLVVLVGTLSRSPSLHVAFHEALEASHGDSAEHPESGHDADSHAEEADCALCLFSHRQWLGLVSLPEGTGSTIWFTPTLGRGPPAQL
jgi:hypothetical protein